MSNYYVIHQNPNHPDIKAGEEWAIDDKGFETEKEAIIHANNCEYRVKSITHRVVTEEELLEIIKGTRPVQEALGAVGEEEEE